MKAMYYIQYGNESLEEAIANHVQPYDTVEDALYAGNEMVDLYSEDKFKIIKVTANVVYESGEDLLNKSGAV